MAFGLKNILRENIAGLIPYSSARDEYTGSGSILLDANENPFNEPLNRYPDPHQRRLKVNLAKVLKIKESSLFLGNGSDEAIDLLMRAFCVPGKDEIITIDPSYGMYEVAAKINDLKIKKVLLNWEFGLESSEILKAVDPSSKMIFLCSPNNPTGNLLDPEEILILLKKFNGLVVVDEAYIDFTGTPGLIGEIDNYGNLVLLRTLSKAWGLAGIRLGMAIASAEIIHVLDRIKYPYNINSLTQTTAENFVRDVDRKEDWVGMIVQERDKLANKLTSFKFVLKVYPSDANFLLVKMSNSNSVYHHLKHSNIIVRDRSSVSLCQGCLRITIGSPRENELLLEALENLEEEA